MTATGRSAEAGRGRQRQAARRRAGGGGEVSAGAEGMASGGGDAGARREGDGGDAPLASRASSTCSAVQVARATTDGGRRLRGPAEDGGEAVVSHRGRGRMLATGRDGWEARPRVRLVRPWRVLGRREATTAAVGWAGATPLAGMGMPHFTALVGAAPHGRGGRGARPTTAPSSSAMGARRAP